MSSSIPLNPSAPTPRAAGWLGIPPHWWSALLFMSLGMFMWAVIENIPRFFSQHYTTFQIVWMRYSVHILFMLALFVPRFKTRMFRTRRLGWQLVRGLLMMGMHLTFIFAIRSLSVGQTMSAFWIAPLALLVLGQWIGEKSAPLHWLLTLAAYGGVLLIIRPENGLLHTATLLSLGMALCFALYLWMTRRMLDEDLLASLFYTAFSVWVVLGLGLPWYWVRPNLFDLGLFAAIGLLGYAAILGFDKALEAAPAPWVAPMLFTQPVFALLADWAMRGQIPGRADLAGAALVLGCLAVLGWQARRIAGQGTVPLPGLEPATHKDSA